MFAHILIPTDGSRLSERAVRKGVLLARHLGADVTGLIATPTYKIFTLDPVMSRDSISRYEVHSRQFAAEALEVIGKAAAAQGVPCKLRHVQSDHPSREILRAADRGRMDLIVMASHGRKGIAGVLLGSETRKVLTHSKIPVMVCR